jgi:hypothetical protein
MSVHQAIVVVKGQSPMDLVRMSVRAGMEIMNQFDPTRSAYAGPNEHKLFKKDFDEWVDSECEQKLFVADNSELLDEIEYYCNLEGAPTNFISGETETKIMVIGPFDSERLKYFTQNCTSF